MLLCNLIFNACIVGLVEIAPNFFELHTMPLHPTGAGAATINTYYTLGPVSKFSQNFLPESQFGNGEYWFFLQILGGGCPSGSTPVLSGWGWGFVSRFNLIRLDIRGLRIRRRTDADTIRERITSTDVTGSDHSQARYDFILFNITLWIKLAISRPSYCTESV